MSYIGKQPIIGNFVKLDAITVVNGQASYTMQNGGSNFTEYANVNQFLVSLNGILQSPTDSFSVASSTITFASNLVTGDVIDHIIVLGNTLDAGVPSDNTVSLAKLTATGTKDATTFLRGDNTFAQLTDTNGLVKLANVTTTDATTSNIEFDSTYINSTYDAYKIISQIHPVTDSAELRIRLSVSGTFQTNGTYYGFGVVNDGGSGINTNQTDNWDISTAIGNVDGEGCCTDHTLIASNDTKIPTQFVGTASYRSNVGTHAMQTGAFGINSADAHDGIRFYLSSGNFDTGSSVTLYGVQK